MGRKITPPIDKSGEEGKESESTMDWGGTGKERTNTAGTGTPPPSPPLLVRPPSLSILGQPPNWTGHCSAGGEERGRDSWRRRMDGWKRGRCSRSYSSFFFVQSIIIHSLSSSTSSLPSFFLLPFHSSPKFCTACCPRPFLLLLRSLFYLLR